MDPLTHSLVGWLAARAGAERLGPYATPTLIIAANIPDISLAQLAAGPSFYLNYAGWSHSILGAAALGAGVGFAFQRWAARRGRSVSSRNLVVAGLIGSCSHLLLDWMTSWSIPLFWPLHGAGYTLDWFNTVDLWALFILLLGVGLPALFSLISEEIGARRTRAGLRRGAWVALVAFALLAGGRGLLHQTAVARLEARLYDGRTPLRLAAFPAALTPFRWNAVIETPDTFEAGSINPLGANEPDRFQTWRKPQPSHALEAALASDTGRTFLSWARFPWAEVVPYGSGWEVELQDLRQVTARPLFLGFAARIELDPSLAVVKEEIDLKRD